MQRSLTTRLTGSTLALILGVVLLLPAAPVAAQEGATFISDYVADFERASKKLVSLAEAMPEKKKPREPFPFAEENMMRLLGSLSQNMMWLDPIRLFGMLNGLYWFMEFLEDTLSLSSEQAKMNRESCVRLFEQAYPAQRKQDFKALAWERFPREK